ncbi:MAG: hypothetical protein K2X08_04915, partial [Chlamydiales bacterium]|nr:hypothetical protein [Chlamydiales bacterium]
MSTNAPSRLTTSTDSQSPLAPHPTVDSRSGISKGLCRAALGVASLGVASIALGCALGFYLSFGEEDPTVNNSLTRFSSQEPSLAQDVALTAVAALPTIAFLGAAVRDFRDNQDRQMTLLSSNSSFCQGLAGDLAFQTDRLGQGLEQSMLQRPSVENMCFPVNYLEQDLKAAMQRARPCLLLDETELTKYGNKHT